MAAVPRFHPALYLSLWARRCSPCLVNSGRCQSSLSTKGKQQENASDIQFIIRKARRSDCGTMARQIVHLAQHEGLQDGPEARENGPQLTEEDLIRYGFDAPRPHFHALILEVQKTPPEASSLGLLEEEHTRQSDNTAESASQNDTTSFEPKVIGHSIYSIGFCKWQGKLMYYEDMFIQPEYRGYGLGIAVQQTAIKHAYESGCTKAVSTIAQTNERAWKFWTKLGWKRLKAGGSGDYATLDSLLVQHERTLAADTVGLHLEYED